MATNRFSLLCSVFAAFVAAAALRPAEARAQGAAAYVVSDNTTGYILDSANAQQKLQVGSLTKIATAMVVLDWADARQQDLAQLATVPASAVPLATTQGVGFQPGDQCSLRDLLYAALMQSDNQAAETIADHVGRSLGPVLVNGRPSKDKNVTPVTSFVAQMNALARKIGMTNTRFTNAHGLDNLEKTLPYSTAADLAKLTAYAMNRPAFRFYVSQPERKITINTASAGSSSYMLRNTNELVGTDNIDGVKTGTTRKAGQCVIISAAKAPESRQEGETHVITPRRLNVVVLGAGDRFGIARQLLAKGWQQYDAWAAAGRPMPAVNSARR
ncbi:D-alanyl-D-alanine carboxypeptidase family protein [Verrucomicrobiota bacterium sgz303538]